MSFEHLNKSTDAKRQMVDDPRKVMKRERRSMGLLVRASFVVALIALSGGSGAVFARESSYSPPNVQPSSEAAARAQYYANFRREMNSIPANKREELKAEFIRKRDAPGVSQAERSHYNQLIRILSGG